MAYAWAPIDAGEKQFKLGDSVSAGDLEIDDREFQALVDSGAVREYEPPKLPDTYQGSILDYVREQRAKNEEEEMLVMTGGSTFAPTSADVILAGFEGATPDEYAEELEKRHEEQVKAAEDAAKDTETPKAAAAPKQQAKSGTSGS
jgi:hypothetical protein